MSMNRCRLSLCSMLLAVMLASVTLAQELPSQQEHIKGLEPFMGFWQGELTDVGVTLNVSGRWASNGSYAQFQFSVRGEEERTHVGTVIVGYSGEEQKVKMWGFWPDSAIEGTVTDVKDGTLAYQSTGVNADGTKATADATWKAEGDEVTIHITNRQSDGQQQPDMHVKLQRRERRRSQN